MADLLDLLAEIEAGPLRAPLRYTNEVHDPAELRRSWAAWVDRHDSFGAGVRCHQWRPNDNSVEGQDEASGHAFLPLQAWLGCPPGQHGGPVTLGGCQCVGGELVRAWCECCEWASAIVTSMSAAVAAWHDHAWPGWRELPVLEVSGPFEESARKRWSAYVEENYPPQWGRPGAPVITERGPFGHRDVPGRSPWGGFDISVTTLTRT